MGDLPGWCLFPSALTPGLPQWVNSSSPSLAPVGKKMKPLSSWTSEGLQTVPLIMDRLELSLRRPFVAMVVTVC